MAPRPAGRSVAPMVTLRTDIRVDGLSAADIYDFLIEPSDAAYQQWWPGTHFQFHPVTRHPGHLGEVVYMDELVGRRRLRMHAVVVEAESGRRIVWQFKKLVRLPARLTLDLADRDGGVAISHRIDAGYAGVARIFDPLLRIYLSKPFGRALDEHVRTEFPRLRDLFNAATAR